MSERERAPLWRVVGDGPPIPFHTATAARYGARLRCERGMAASVEHYGDCDEPGAVPAWHDCPSLVVALARAARPGPVAVPWERDRYGRRIPPGS